MIGRGWQGLAMVLQAEGHLAAAWRCYSASLAIYTALNDQGAMADLDILLAALVQERGIKAPDPSPEYVEGKSPNLEKGP